jgi:hypothetical protein
MKRELFLACMHAFALSAKETMAKKYRITTITQYHSSIGIQMRELKNRDKRKGEYVNYSNNAEAFAVIL